MFEMKRQDFKLIKTKRQNFDFNLKCKTLTIKYLNRLRL